MPKMIWGKSHYHMAFCYVCGKEKSMDRIVTVGSGQLHICLRCVRKIVRAYLERYI